MEAAIGSTRLHCDTLGRIDDEALRACGVSGNKARALRDLAKRECAGEIPTMSQLAWMEAQSIVDALVPVRGDFNDDLRAFGLGALREAVRAQLRPEDAERFLGR